MLGDQPLSGLLAEIQAIYLSDKRPWVIGYSGGKDSTAVAQLVFSALLALDPEVRHKPVFVVSSDTLVETPLVINLIAGNIERMNVAATQHGLPLSAAQVQPDLNDSYWVNLLGRGYPAPTKQFRWCTERLKIDPISRFIKSKVATYGEVVVVLGSRVAESATRAQVIRKHKIAGQRLASHTTLPSAYVYTPIESWSADDVWEYLFSMPVPWGGNHQVLLDLYRDSNAGECPLVVDTSTPSCGNSRFGCWVCTVVTKDKAIEGLIASGETWLTPLLEFRDLLAATTIPENKNHYRNHRRRTGQVHVAKDGETHVPGPYWMWFRKELVTRLLKLQKSFSDAGRDYQLITEQELREIRRLWMQDPVEPDWEDFLPKLHREVFAEDLAWSESDAGVFTNQDAELIAALGESHNVPATLVMKLLELELSLDGLSKRSGLMSRVDHLLSQDWSSLTKTLAKHKNMAKSASGYDTREDEMRRIYEANKQ